MTRWKPDGRRRLEDAALQLFSERGYDQTTVAEVAEAAGLTERTFFRHFTDKKEVLFDSDGLTESVRERAASSTATSLVEMALDGFRVVADEIEADPARVRRRARVIASAQELQEREMLKLFKWSGVIHEALTSAGANSAAAEIASEVANALFRIAYRSWIEGDESGSLLDALDDLLELHRTVAGSAPRAEPIPVS